jgi:3-oxoacyl-[acyl-carrier protein] reductase
MELRNKKIIITGGAGGIGSAIVKSLLDKGAVVGVVDYDKERLKKLNETIPEDKKAFFSHYCVDISEFESVQNTVQDFYEKHGSIDGLINCAAILKDGFLVSVFKGEIKKYPIEDWEKTLRSNLYGPFYFTREVAEKMIQKRTKGVIVNVSSMSSAGNLGQTSYAASKAAMNALTVTWARELAMFGVRVAGLSPGMTDTAMSRSIPENLLNDWIGKTPLKKMATPEEIAHGVFFILENDFFCGRMLELDGGLRM